MKFLWTRTCLSFLFSFSIFLFILLQVFLYKDGNPKRNSKKVAYIPQYVALEDDNIVEKYEQIQKYNGYNSCVVSSITDYKTLDILQVVESNHRNDIEDDNQPQVTKVKKDLQLLEVIIVPHSHNDPGWINTFEGHYEEQSKWILSNMVGKMAQYEQMTFVWAEMVLFSKWWNEVDQEQREQARQLIKEGRLEILGGGWVVPDEATTHYEALLNNFLEGHLWLRKHLNYKPTTSWSLDPFGYSSFLPHLYKRIGLQNMVLLRVHTEVKRYIMQQKLQHFRWRPVWSGSGADDDAENDMNAFMLPYKLYNIKYQCGPDNDVCLQFDFRQIAGEFSESVAVPVSNSNIYHLATLLTQQLRKKADLQRNNHVVMFPLGDDFRFDKEVEWDQQYGNYLKLISFVNSHSSIFNVTMRFGTVKDFFHVLNRKQAEDVPTLSGDFFPYSDNPDDYWTGYYTSRIWLKKSIRMLESLVHAAELVNIKTLFSSGQQTSSYAEAIEALLSQVRSNVSLLQHHDAITGTSSVLATRDFYLRSVTAREMSEAIIRQSLTHSLGHASPQVQFKIFSEALNQQARKFLLVASPHTDVLFFNPLISTYVEPLELYIETDQALSSEGGSFLHLKKYALVGGSVVMQGLECALEGVSSRTYLLHFFDQLQPLSYQFYRVFVSDQPSHPCSFQEDFDYNDQSSLHNSPPLGTVTYSSSEARRKKKKRKQLNEFSILTNCSTLYFNRATGNLVRVQLPGHAAQQLDVRFFAYTANGDGPYLFRPLKAAAEMGSSSGRSRFSVSRSALMHIVEVQVDELLRVRYKVPVQTKCSGGVSLDVEVSSDMRVEADQNQEIVMRVASKIKSGFLFYTDSNAFNAMQRKRMPSLSIAANFYPATSFIFIEDSSEDYQKDAPQENYRLSLLMSEPHGVSSQASGQLEVMLDRMTSYDDGKGVGGGVFDNMPTTAAFKLLLDRFEMNTAASSDSDAESTHHHHHHHHHPPMRHPTLDARMALEQMRHKPIRAASTSLSLVHISSLLSTDWHINASSLPCDVVLSSGRNLHDFIADPSKQTSFATYLAFHRFSWQAGFHVSSFNHLHERFACQLASISSDIGSSTPLSGVQSFSSWQLIFSQLLPKSLKITFLSSTSLTLLHRKHKLNPRQAVCLNASSINAFLLLSTPLF